MGNPIRSIAGILLLLALVVTGFLLWDRDEAMPSAMPMAEENAAVVHSGPTPAPALAASDLESGTPSLAWPSHWRIAVLSRDTNQPIPGATLSLSTDEALTAFGSTDANGDWSGDWPASNPPWQVCVAADGYLTKTFTCHVGSSQFVLQTEGIIKGHLVGAPSEALKSGSIEVFAWDASKGEFEELRISGRDREPTFARSVVQADGSFVVRGLRRSGSYTLLAVGPSFGTPDPVVEVRPDEESISLLGFPVHGAILRVTGPNGTALRCSPSVVQDHPASFSRLLANDARVSSPMDLCMMMLRLDSSHEELQPDDEMFSFYLPLGDSAQVELQVVRPGYHVWRGEVTIPLATQPLTQIPIILQPWTEDFGRLQLNLRGLCQLGPREYRAEERPDAQLHLLATELKHPMTDQPLSLTAAIPDISRLPLGVGPLPAGDYVLTLQSAFDRRSPVGEEDSQFVRVRADRIVEVDFDVADLGAILVVVADQRGPYLGRTQVRVLNDGALTDWHFASAPYRIPLLPEGLYEIGVSTGVKGVPWAPPSELSSVFAYPGRLNLHWAEASDPRVVRRVR